MRLSAYKIISMLLAFTLAMMPVRLAFAGGHDVNAHDLTAATQIHDAGMHSHDDYAGMPCVAPCNNPSDTGSDASSHDCSSGMHCCITLFGSMCNAAYVAPHVPRSRLSVTLTGITLPAATKPPRYIF